MKQKISNVIIVCLVLFLNSCTIKVSDSDDDGGNGNNISFISMNNPVPFDGATGIPLTPALSWDVQSSNTNNLMFNIFLDTMLPPNKFAGQSFSPNLTIYTPLAENKMYFWQVKAVYDNGEEISNVWSFTTVTGGLPTDGLIAYYPFNGNANDESGNGHTGTVNGALLMPDRFNQSNGAYYFDGISSSITVPSSFDLNPLTGITLSAWLYFESRSCTSSIITKGSDLFPGCYSLRFDYTGSTLDFIINFADGTKKLINIYTSLSNQTWYSLTGIYDGAYMKIYLNGQPFGTIPVSLALGQNNDVLQFGNSAEGYAFNGRLDDIRIYSRALNDGEVQQVYHEGGWQANDKLSKRGKIK